MRGKALAPEAKGSLVPEHGPPLEDWVFGGFCSGSVRPSRGGYGWLRRGNAYRSLSRLAPWLHLCAPNGGLVLLTLRANAKELELMVKPGIAVMRSDFAPQLSNGLGAGQFGDASTTTTNEKMTILVGNV